MSGVNVEMVRSIRRELGRRSIDSSEIIVSVIGSVVHLAGMVRPARGHEADFEKELAVLDKVIRHHQGVRDVVMEWTAEFKEEGITKRLSAHR